MTISLHANLHQRMRHGAAAIAAATRVKSRVSYQIADRREDLRTALGMVYEAYHQLGYIESNPFRVRVMPQHLLPTTEVLLARIDGQPVGTSTLVLDAEPLGMPLQAAYPAEVRARRKAGRVLAEASCLAHSLAVKPPLSVVVRLMAMTIQVAKCRGADELLAVVHPHHLDFYTGFLGFKPFGDVKIYAAVRNHPAVGIALDLHRLQSEHPKAYKRAFVPPFPEETLRHRSLSAEVRDDLRRVLAGNGHVGEFTVRQPAERSDCQETNA